MPSIGDSQRAAGGNNLHYYQKQRQYNALSGDRRSLHIRSAHPLQSPDHIYFGRYLSMEPPTGLRLVNQTGFGLFNGGGFLPPPPRPGARLVTGDVGQSVCLRLGEIFQHGGSGEIGPDALQDGTNLPITSSPWIAPAAQSMDGLTFISYIPIEGEEYPANQVFYENRTGTNYDINIGTATTLTNLTAAVQQGEFSTTTDRVLGDIELSRAINDYEESLIPEDLPDELVLAPGFAPILPTEEEQPAGWLQTLETLLNLPIGNETYRESIYCVLQNLASDAWSGTGDSPLGELQQRLNPLSDIQGILDKVNKWLPLALQVKDFIFGQTAKATVGQTSLDLDTLDLTIDLNQALADINQHLDTPITLNQNQLTICGRTISTEDTYDTIPEDLLACLSQLNQQLPTPLQFKTYGTARITAVRIAAGIFISEGQALTLQNKIGNPVEIAVNHLRCRLPIEVADALELTYDNQTLSAKSFSLTEFLSLTRQVLGYLENPGQLVQQLNRYLPGALQDFFQITDNQIQINPDSLFQFGVETLNDSLPAQLQLQINSSGGSLQSVQLGPVSFSLAEGEISLGLDLSRIAGGLNIQSYLDLVPDRNVRELLDQALLEVKLPYDNLNIESSLETINQGGYLIDIPELNLTNNRNGSPIPLLLSTLECLTPLGQDSGTTPQLPAQQNPAASFISFCFDPASAQTSLANIIDTVRVDNVTSSLTNSTDQTDLSTTTSIEIDVADSTTYPEILMTTLTQTPFVPTQPSQLTVPPTPATTPLARFLETLGVPSAQYFLTQLGELETTKSVIPLVNLVQAVASTPTQVELAAVTSVLQAIDPPSSPCLPYEETLSLYPPLSWESLIEDPTYLADWIEMNEPRLTTLTESLLYGEMYDFFVNLIYLFSGEYIPNHPRQDSRLKSLILNHFDLPD